MSAKSHEAVIESLVKANGNFSLAVERSLIGFMRQVGGPEQFGRDLGKMLQNEEASISSRVTLATNMLKIMSNCDSGKLGEDEIADEQLDAVEEMLSKMDGDK